MERQLWKEIVAVVRELCKRTFNVRCGYSDVEIVKVWFWAVIHDRPVSWACCRENWPPYEQRRSFPTSSTMSRRLRTASIRQLLATVEERTLHSDQNRIALVWALDGKPLPISGCSKDHDARYGRAAGGKAKGYKIHAIISLSGAVAAWKIAPMNVDERAVGEELLGRAAIQGYVLADGNYDSNKLHAVCTRRGNLQLVVPRRYGPHHGHGHRRQDPGRLRSKELLENPNGRFGPELHLLRDAIERFYAHLTNWGGSLTHLPPWARSLPRVHRWVQAKLILHAIKRTRQKITTYVA